LQSPREDQPSVVASIFDDLPLGQQKRVEEGETNGCRNK
jgi:hypothetical protein